MKKFWPLRPDGKPISLDGEVDKFGINNTEAAAS